MYISCLRWGPFCLFPLFGAWYNISSGACCVPRTSRVFLRVATRQKIGSICQCRPLRCIFVLFYPFASWILRVFIWVCFLRQHTTDHTTDHTCTEEAQVVHEVLYAGFWSLIYFCSTTLNLPWLRQLYFPGFAGNTHKSYCVWFLSIPKIFLAHVYLTLQRRGELCVSMQRIISMSFCGRTGCHRCSSRRSAYIE